MSQLFTILTLLFLVAGCQLTPTKVTSQNPVFAEDLSVEKLLQGQPVILDTRPSFEFHLSHVPGAINVRWEDFSQRNLKMRGLLQNDLFAVARRFALMGIDPDTKVLVLGNGLSGEAEEGRVAWTLKVLGVQHVYTLNHTAVRELNTLQEEPLRQNKSIWKPVVNTNLTIDLDEFIKSVTVESPEVVIDVRSSQEFESQFVSRRKSIRSRILNIPWQKFFTQKGVPNSEIIKELQKFGIQKDTPMIFIGNHGVDSGAVTFAMNLFGYTSVRNFAGGYVLWK